MLSRCGSWKAWTKATATTAGLFRADELALHVDHDARFARPRSRHGWRTIERWPGAYPTASTSSAKSCRTQPAHSPLSAVTPNPRSALNRSWSPAS